MQAVIRLSYIWLQSNAGLISSIGQLPPRKVRAALDTEFFVVRLDLSIAFVRIGLLRGIGGVVERASLSRMKHRELRKLRKRIGETEW